MDQKTGRGDRKQAAERQAAALAMRRDGKDFDTIAAALGYASRSGAHNAVMAALKKHVAKNVDGLRELEGLRLDALQDAVWPAAMAGDVAAVRAAVSISERRARLFGFDSPAPVLPSESALVTVEFADARGKVHDAIARIASRLRAPQVEDGQA